MLRILRLVPIALLAGALASCMPDPEAGLPQNMSAEAQAACLATGGRVARDGEGQLQLCHRTFSDGGRMCRKSTDCQGGCVIEAATARQGVCATATQSYGCNWWLDENGKPAGGMCLD